MKDRTSALRLATWPRRIRGMFNLNDPRWGRGDEPSGQDGPGQESPGQDGPGQDGPVADAAAEAVTEPLPQDVAFPVLTPPSPATAPGALLDATRRSRIGTYGMSVLLCEAVALLGAVWLGPDRGGFNTTASWAVPAGGPVVTIGGRRFMDGGIGSAVNMALAADCDTAVALVPQGRSTPSPFGTGAAEEVDGFDGRSLGIFADDDALAAFGKNPLDPACRVPSAQAGRAQGRRVAAEVAAFLAG